MNHLATRGIWCCGTVQVPQIPGIKKTKDDNKNLIQKEGVLLKSSNLLGTQSRLHMSSGLTTKL